MFCGHCGRQIPDDSIFCPLCGASLTNQAPVKKDFSQETLSRYGQPSYQEAQAPAQNPGQAPAFQGGAGQGQWQGGYGAPAHPQMPQDPYQTGQWQTGQVPQGQPTQGQPVQGQTAYGQWQTGQFQTGQWQDTSQLPPFQQYQEPGKPKKQKKASSGGKKKGLLIGGICGGVVLVLALVAVFFWSQVSNFFVRTFSSPEKYYQFVESRNIDDVAGTASGAYDQVILKCIDTQNNRVEFNVTIKPEEPLLDLLNAAGGRIDFDWLEEVKISGVSNFSDGMGSTTETAYLNDDELINLNAVLDTKKNLYYIQVPEFSEDWIKFDPYSLMSGGSVPMYQASQIYSVTNIYSQLPNMLPDAEITNRLIARYGKIVLDQIHDVSKESETLKIRNVSGHYTALTIELDEDTVKDILNAVIEAMMDDKDIEDLIKKMAPIYGPAMLGTPNVDEDEFYDRLIEQMEKLQDEMDDFFMDDPIEMKIWVDGKGEIAARKINYRDHELFVGMTEAGGKFGLELSYTRDDREYVSLKGTGTKSGDKLTGSLTFSSDETELAEIKLESFDKEQVKKGFFDGKVIVYPTQEFYQAAGLSRMMQQFKSFASDLAIMVDGKTTESEGKLTLQILTDDDPFVTIQMESKKKKAEEVDKVKGAVDYMEWTRNIEPSDLEDFVDKLEKTDLPKELIDYLRSTIPGQSYPAIPTE